VSTVSRTSAVRSSTLTVSFSIGGMPLYSDFLTVTSPPARLVSTWISA
jgi:hypothetical protein